MCDTQYYDVENCLRRGETDAQQKNKDLSVQVGAQHVADFYSEDLAMYDDEFFHEQGLDDLDQTTEASFY